MLSRFVAVCPNPIFLFSYFLFCLSDDILQVTSAIQCGGNRRSEMNSVAVTAGSPWGISAISNAHWEGARLVDVLRASGAGLLHHINHINVRASLRNSIQYLRQPIHNKDFDDAISGDEDALHENGVLHVQFAAAEGMEASIPLHKALNTCELLVPVPRFIEVSGFI